jgi:hypothetical protein
VSYQIGMDTLRLRESERLAHTEYCSNEALVRAVTGRDPAADEGARNAFRDASQLDFLWLVNDGPVPWAGPKLFSRGWVPCRGKATGVA